MTATTQRLVMDRLAARLSAAKLVFAVDYDYSNNGRVRVFDPATLEERRALTFDFQPSGFQFRRVGSIGPFACHTFGGTRTSGMIDAVKDSPAEVLDAVVEYLTGGAK